MYISFFIYITARLKKETFENVDEKTTKRDQNFNGPFWYTPHSMSPTCPSNNSGAPTFPQL